MTVSAVGGSSRVTVHDRYRFLAAPAVSKLTPSSGKGGTKVKIRGSNFVGVVSVRFGRNRAAGVHVLSSSEITVTAPRGSGTVYVTVSAVGGSSRDNAASRYRY